MSEQQMSYAEGIKEYVDYLTKNFYDSDHSNYTQRFEITTEELKKYTKVSVIVGQSKSTHSFVVKEYERMFDGAGNFKDFFVGDILFAQDQKSPSLVPTCGNVLRKEWGTIRWSQAGTRSRRKPGQNLVNG